jgi:uncharacterized protein involved in response to NO
MNITNKTPAKFALFNIGFRIFFLGASVYSIVAILFWMGIYVFNISLPANDLSVFQWHAHEMVFAYSLAVIACLLFQSLLPQHIQLFNPETGGS